MSNSTTDEWTNEPILELQGAPFEVEGEQGSVLLRVFAGYVAREYHKGLQKLVTVVRLGEVEQIRVEQNGINQSTLVIDTLEGRHLVVPGLSDVTAFDAQARLTHLLAALDAEVVDEFDSADADDDESGPAIEFTPRPDDEPPKTDRQTLADELRHLNFLRTDGSISEQEFSERKAALFAKNKRPR